MVTELEWAYLAGFFDGDGCVNIATRQQRKGIGPQHYLQIIFSQCNQPILEYWRERVNRGRVYRTAHPDNGHKQLYQWRMFDRDAEVVLRAMLPHLHIKRKEAQIALKFQRTKREHSGRRGVAPVIIRLRESYKRMLHEAKRGEFEAPEMVQEFERIADSQLTLF